MQEERREHRRRPVSHGGHGGLKFLLWLIAVLAVVGGILSLTNIGGDMILNAAQKALKEQANLNLTADGVSGNPIRGYTLQDFAIAPEGGGKILSAKSLFGRVNFMALLRGNPRLANLSVGGVDMDLDQFITEIQKVKFPESSEDSGELNIPIDRISLEDSRFTSKWGTVLVNEVGADIDGRNMDLDVNGMVNGIPVKGTANMDVSSGTTIAINRSNVNFGSGKVSATGGIHPISATDTTTTLDLQGAVQDLDLKELTALWATLSSADYNGTANANVEVSGPTSALKLTGTVDYKGTRLGGYPVERVGAAVSYSDGRVEISDIQASALSIPISGAAAIATHEDKLPSVMIKLDGSDAVLDGLDKTFPALAGVGGRVSSFSANIQGPVNALNGIVNLEAPQVSWQGKSVTNIKAQLKLAGSDKAILDGKFNFEGAKGFLNGSVSSILTGPQSDLKATLLDLDLARVAGMIPDASHYGLAGKVTTKLGIKGSTSNPSVTGTIESAGVSAQLSGQKYMLEKPSIAFAFANQVLTLQKSSGTLNKMPVNLKGTVGPLSSSTPPINMSATLTISPAALAAFVPDVKNYALKGDVNAGVKLTGKLPNPNVDFVATSANLSAMNLLTAKDLEVTTALGGDLTKLSKLDVNAKAGSVTASGVTFTNLAASVSRNGDAINLTNFSAKSGSGSITGSGSAGTSANAKLDLSFNLDRLDLTPLAAASGAALKGILTGSVKVGGTTNAPSFSFNGSAPSVTAQGFTLTNLAADVSGTDKSVNINSFKAEVGGAPLTASGTVQMSPMAANLTICGNALDLEALTKDYPDMAGQLIGKANLTFDVATNAKGCSGKGAITSSALKAFGLNLTDVNLPLSLNANTFASSGGTANLYGGSAKNTLTFDIKSSKFTDELSANNVDVNALIQDVSGGIGGKITGRGKLSMKLSGAASPKTTYSGSGEFTMGEGAITGFTGLNLATKLYGTNGIRYIGVKAPFVIQSGKLILKSGAIASAYQNDPLYRYAKITPDGAFNFDKTLHIPVEAVVNYQLINALTGGGKGALEGLSGVVKGGVNLADTLKQTIGGGMKGAQEGGAKADFRTVTLTVKGKADSPSIANLKIGESTLKSDDTGAASADRTPAGSATATGQQKAEPAPAKDPADGKAREEKSVTDQIADKVMDAIIPSKKEDAPGQPEADRQGQPDAVSEDSTPPKNPREEMKDKLKEELGKELKKGLGDLFRK